MDTHKAIRTKFNIKKHNDNLPIRTKKGGRNELAELLGEQGFNRGVEIGVQWGKFSQVLCEKNPNIELYSIDPWRAGSQKRTEQKFEGTKSRLKDFNATIIRKASMDAFSDFKDKSLDFAYIDGNHSFDFVCPDIIFWSAKVRTGGIIACHDYFNFRRSGVIKAVDAYTNCHHIDPWYVTYELQPTAFWVKP